MSSDPKPAATHSAHAATGGLRAASIHPRHAMPGDRVRAYGDKISALHARRRRAEARREAANDAAVGTKSLSSSDGEVGFYLTWTQRGLLVERVQCRPAGSLLRQSMLFEASSGFECWCEAEPLRLDEPGLWARLRRIGDEAFRGRS